MAEMPTFPEGFLSCVLALGLNPLDINPTYYRTFEQFLAQHCEGVARAAKVEALQAAFESILGLYDDNGGVNPTWKMGVDSAARVVQLTINEAGEGA